MARGEAPHGLRPRERAARRAARQNREVVLGASPLRALHPPMKQEIK